MVPSILTVGEFRRLNFFFPSDVKKKNLLWLISYGRSSGIGSPEPLNAVVLEERLSSSSSSSSSSNQTAGIAAEYLQRAEEATQGIIAQVQPTVVSENRGREVTDYVQRLLRNWLGCEVFPFGSVPLKTYLPDGDIDLTAFGHLNGEEALASNVCSVLEREDQNRAAEFVVKDVQMIRAEVKLSKMSCTEHCC